MFNDLLTQRYKFGVMDCAILAQEVFRRYGMDVPVSDAARLAVEQVHSSEDETNVIVNEIERIWIPIEDPVVPCLVVIFMFNVCHVGVFIGENKFIHTSRLRRYPTIESLDNILYANRKFYTFNGNS